MQKWRFSPSDEPEMTDDEYELIGTGLSVQCCLYGSHYAVNEWNDDEEFSTFHGEFKSLRAAKTRAEEIAAA